MSCSLSRFLVAAVLVMHWGSTGLARTAPRFYVAVRDVTQAKEVKCELKSAAKSLLDKTLAKHPSVVTRLDKDDLSGAKLEAELKARKLVGYAVILRITRCTDRLLPPRAGHAYKVLAVEVATAIDAERMPSSKMAAAGDGSAEVATEVTTVKPKELDSLRLEALTAAIEQAVEKFVHGLEGDEPNQPAKKRRRR